MPLPGFGGRGSMRTVVLSSSATDVDVYPLLGSPSSPISYMLVINAGVVISSSAAGNTALTANLLPAGSTGLWLNMGKIHGAGGAGGAGADDSDDFVGGGGGGGGGGGTIVGPGGAKGRDGGTQGTAGTASAGGTGGTTTAHVTHDILIPASNGSVGTDAVVVNHDITLINGSGEIWGGGGGGAGGWYWFSTSSGRHGGDGGAPGQDGLLGTRMAGTAEYTSGGAAGYAIRLQSGATATFVSGASDPNIKGLVA